MGDVVNLRRARKQRERTASATQAAANRAAFGRTKVEKAAEDADRQRAARDLDGARREPVDAG